MSKVFFEIHSQLLREGPGSYEDTARALRFCRGLPSSPSILDLGCGAGAQSIDLAHLTDGQIISVDLRAPFLKSLELRAQAEGLSDRIKTFQGSMRDLLFEAESQDLIWSEGAIYFLGMKNGLLNWKRMLKPGGYISVTEPVWLRADAPAEVRANWAEYAAMASVDENLKIIEACGLEVAGHFTLSDQAWRLYYDPLKERALCLKEKYASDAVALAVVNETLTEIEVYDRYKEYFGYEFFVMKNADRK